MKRQLKNGVKGTVSGLKNLILRSTGNSLRPRWLMFAVTDRCNSRCRHCDIWRGEVKEELLKPDEIERILSDPVFSGIEYIINSGGEPTTRNDLEEVILAEHKALPNARLQLSTNGLLPDRAISLAKLCIREDIPLDVGISLDGVGEKHDEIRGVKGNFEKVDHLLHELTTLKNENNGKPDISAGMVLSDLTLPALKEIEEYLSQFGLKPNIQWYNEAPFYKNDGVNPAGDIEGLTRTIKSLEVNYTNDLWQKSLKGKSPQFKCFALYTFIALHCNGDIVPCLRYWEVTAGNVKDSSPIDVWNSDEANKARKIVKNCKGCLNEWGVDWSCASCYYPLVLHSLKHPRKLVKKLLEK